MDLFGELGIKLQDAVAGLAGGVVNAFIFQRSSPIAVTGSVVVGTLTASYLSENAAHYIKTFAGIETSGPGTAFIVGLCAMAICQGLVAAGQRLKFGPPSTATGEKNGP